MTTAENLNRIIKAKSDIKQAIENKGVTVGDMTIDGYAAKINEILQEVVEGNKWALPEGTKLSESEWVTFDGRQIDTSNVTDMSYVFQSCRNLTSIDLSNWDTSNVTDMSYMFNHCTNLTSLDLSNWDTSKVDNMSGMFSNCANLTSLDLSSLDLSNVSIYSHMFSNCKNLTEVKMGVIGKRIISVLNMFNGITTTGTFYYNPQYDYSEIIAVLPSTWTAVPME